MIAECMSLHFVPENLSHFGCLLHKLQVEMTDVAEFKLCDKLERKLFGN